MESGVPPRCAARFSPERRLAAGGFGAVWLARQEELDRPVALKVLHPEVVQDAGALARFRNEARLTANLRHGNIVVVIDHGVEDGVPWIAYEYVPGHSLREELTGSPMHPAQALKIARQVASALEEAHAHGVLHRDIKPDNLLLPGDGTVKVADFGLARRTDAAAITSAGLIVGTPGYIAPERIHGEPATPAGDVYAVGVLLFEMLTGRLPFPGDHPVQMLERQVRDPVPLPSSLVPSVPPELDALVLNATARDPRDRTPTARVLLAAIDRAEQSLGPQDPLERPATARRTSRSSATRVMTRRPSLTVAAGKARPLGLTLTALALVLAAVGLRPGAPVPAASASPAVAPSVSPWSDPRYRRIEQALEAVISHREERASAWRDAPSYFLPGSQPDQGIMVVSRNFNFASQQDLSELSGVSVGLVNLEETTGPKHPMSVVVGARMAAHQFVVEHGWERNKLVMGAFQRGEIATPPDFMAFLATLEGRKLPGRVGALLRDALVKLGEAIELVAHHHEQAGAYLPVLFEDLRWTSFLLHQSGPVASQEKVVARAAQDLEDKLRAFSGTVEEPAARVTRGMWTWGRIGCRTPEGRSSLEQTLAAIALLKDSAPRARTGLQALENRIRNEMEQEARAKGKQGAAGRAP